MLPDLDRLRVVLVRPRNPLNIGAAARAMSNFGFLRLRLVNPYQVAFREARSAMGAAALLTAAEEFPSTAAAVADCSLVVGTTAIQHRELRHPLRRLEYGAQLIRRECASGCVALLFGSEKTGLSNDDLSHCHWLLHIPTREQHLSMNLGQAVAVCLYELVRDSKPPAPLKKKEPIEKPAPAGQVERISSLLLEALHRSGYVNPIAASSTEERVRRMVRRLDLSSGDADLWLGMLRQILWKIKAAEE
ncbi:MAG TPA: RNA methyltransferase [Terriglobales bacterium]|nr:RNA methyltransferase [Terriglobales bacterium]